MKLYAVETDFIVQQVQTYVTGQLQRYITELTQLCAIDSGSNNKSGLDKMACWLATQMLQLGMDVITIENKERGNDVLGTLRTPGKACTVLLGHTDTVYPPGTALARPLRIENDNFLFAPGAADMKGCILASLFALEALLALGHRPRGEIRLLYVSDEESSQRRSIDLIQQTCQNSQEVLVLEAARENGDIVSTRKGTAWYRLTARGRAAHAGVEPEKGQNAILELAHQILQLQDLQGWLPGLSINPGTITGGTTPNVVPDYAQVRIDLRYLSTSDRLQTEERWKKILHKKRLPEVDVVLELEDYANPMLYTPASEKLIQQAQALAISLGFTLQHVSTGGTSDARFASDLGLPVLDGLGPIGGNDHSPYEYLRIDSIAQRTALLAGLLYTADSRQAL